MLSHTFEQALI